MGRPATAPNRRQVGLDDELWERVTDYRFERRLDSESAALRELVELGLDAAQRRPNPTAKRMPQESSRLAIRRQRDGEKSGRPERPMRDVGRLSSRRQE